MKWCWWKQSSGNLVNLDQCYMINTETDYDSKLINEEHEYINIVSYTTNNKKIVLDKYKNDGSEVDIVKSIICFF